MRAFSLVLWCCSLAGVSSLDVRIPPSILVMKLNGSEIYRTEDDVILECAASGVPQPSYGWMKNGQNLTLPSVNGNIEEILEGETKVNIKIKMSTFDEGSYQCTAWNKYGRTISRPIHLRRAMLSAYGPNPPVFESPPIVEGQPYSLSCAPTKCFPKPTFTWATASSPVDSQQVLVQSDKRIQIDDEGSLHFSYVIPEDARDEKVYKCNLYNPNLDLVIGGSYSRLRVQPMGGVKSFPPSIMFSTKSPIVALEGRNISLRCFFSGYPEPTIAWSRLNGSLPPKRHQINKETTELLILDVQPSDETEYTCRGSNMVSSTEQAIHIDVQAIPVFRSVDDQPHNKNVTDGSNVTMICRPYAKPKATIVWMKNGVPLDVNDLPKRFFLSADLTNLTIVKICKDCPDGSSDLMVIQCLATNVHGSAFSDGYINVLSKTKMTTRPVDVKITKDDEFARFNCSGTSDDSTPLSILWHYIYDTKEERVHNETGRIMLGSDGDLSFSVVKNSSNGWKSLTGLYRCNVSNGYSFEVAQARLEDVDLPIILSPAQPKVAGADLGDWWWLFLIIALILLILILLICCCLCIQRNRGDTYPVDEKERKNGNDPEKELADSGFLDYKRPEGEIQKGSRPSLGSSGKRDSDEEASLSEYGDIDAGKFTEDGSFIGDYGLDNRRSRPADYV